MTAKFIFPLCIQTKYFVWHSLDIINNTWLISISLRNQQCEYLPCPDVEALPLLHNVLLLQDLIVPPSQALLLHCVQIQTSIETHHLHLSSFHRSHSPVQEFSKVNRDRLLKQVLKPQLDKKNTCTIYEQRSERARLLATVLLRNTALFVAKNIAIFVANR